ncbi:hypothetical protein [Streptomyces hirsutus]|uniref:hypothetical protein n=1 Tax=Streptomyces hirsutus TaxID=35620 RepID=UPI00331C0EA1
MGDNPERPGSEASFAALCGVSPVERSRQTGRTAASTAAAVGRPTPPCTGSRRPACASQAGVTDSNPAGGTTRYRSDLGFSPREAPCSASGSSSGAVCVSGRGVDLPNYRPTDQHPPARTACRASPRPRASFRERCSRRWRVRAVRAGLRPRRSPDPSRAAGSCRCRR